MLRIYDVILEVMRELRPALDELRRRHRGLWEQATNALQSVLLNVAEGSGSVGGNRTLRYSTALGSMLETNACFDGAVALGYVRPIEQGTARKIDRVIGTLVKLTAPR